LTDEVKVEVAFNDRYRLAGRANDGEKVEAGDRVRWNVSVRVSEGENVEVAGRACGVVDPPGV